MYEGTQAWDGYIKDKPAQEGLYIYKIQYVETLLDEQKQVLGEVSLLR